MITIGIVPCEDENKLEYIIETHGEKALMGFNDETQNIFVAFRGSENILKLVRQYTVS